MSKEFVRNLQLRCIKVLDALLLTVPFAMCWFFAYAKQTVAPFYFWGNWLVIIFFFILYMTYGRIYEGFRLSLSRVSELLYSQGLALFLSDLILYLMTWLLTKRLPNPLLLTFLVQLGLAAVWCVLARRWYTATVPLLRTAVLYDEREDMQQLFTEYGLDKRFDVRQNLSVGECFAQSFAPLEDTQAVILCGVHTSDREKVQEYCVANNIALYALPRIGDRLMRNELRVHMFHLPAIQLYPSVRQKKQTLLRSGQKGYSCCKRLFDIVFSAVTLLILWPVLAVVALLIKLDSPHEGVIFKQTRIGRDGKPFNLYKFRTLRGDAPHEMSSTEIGNAEQYTTRIGSFLRRTSLDELPQMFNIFCGQMSIIGPRPLILHEEYIHERRQKYGVYSVKPGLTGLAQVNGRKDLDDDTKVWWDWVYVNDMCARTDQIIFWWTVWCVLDEARRKRSADTSMVTDTVQIPLAEIVSNQQSE